MGWLWSNGPKATPPPEATGAPTVAPLSSDKAQPPTGAPKAITREEQADAELQALIEEMSNAPSAYPASSFEPDRRQNTIAKPKQSPFNKSFAAPPVKTSMVPPLTASASPIDPPALLPTTMSCRAAFDQAYHCQLLGGQFTNVYRYGKLRNCSELWSNFWFCMRTTRGQLEDGEREAHVRQHYWDREAQYRTGPSSEDVWEVRRDMLDRPFQGDWTGLNDILKEQRGEN